jgi:NADPH-dependent 2,4-dienoyl-CoA reductase/sulfur reductase-like enzyme
MRTVIVGTSVAGVRAAQALRRNGGEDEILLVGAESHLPYDKPCLSKGMLSGAVAPEKNCLLTESAAAELGIRTALSQRAVGLDPEAAVLHTTAGRIPYDRLVIATGASARTLPWSDLPGVHSLRTRADCEALRADLRRGSRLVVVGGGFIGCEVAATARGLGLDVTIVEPEATLLPVAGPELGALAGEWHAGHGARVRAGEAVRAIVRAGGGLVVELRGGEVLDADCVVLGIGAVPNTGWLEDSGLDIADGIACDAWGRVHGHENVLAAGDVARWQDPVSGTARRIEHWTNATEQAVVVGKVLAGASDVAAHRVNTYVWSDQYDRTMSFVGRRACATRVTRFDDPSTDGVAFVGPDEQGGLAFAAVVNWPRALLAVRKGINGGVPCVAVEEQLTPAA